MRVYVTVTVQMIARDVPGERIERLVADAVLGMDQLDAGEVDVKADRGGPIVVNERGYAVPLPPLHG